MWPFSPVIHKPWNVSLLQVSQSNIWSRPPRFLRLRAHQGQSVKKSLVGRRPAMSVPFSAAFPVFLT